MKSSSNSRAEASTMDHWHKLAEHFLAESGQFRLGALPTEARHPLTSNLSELCHSDLPAAIGIFNEVDLLALKGLESVAEEFVKLSNAIYATLNEGHKVFISGCGATGRLAVSLEVMWRELCHQSHPEWRDRVFGFIAGGDFALVKSIENFEDHPEYGVQQLKDLGFSSHDLLIAVTEGGETPFVIGTAIHAAETSSRTPFFVFCNPPELLKVTTERSRQVLTHPRIQCLYVPTGPMALSGSTRLQATTCQQLGVGAALFSCLTAVGPMGLEKLRREICLNLISDFLNIYKATDFSGLKSLIEAESRIYKSGDYCHHVTDKFGITVLTDTTERTPTFSLLPFELSSEPSPQLSWTYLKIENELTAESAWTHILHRKPRTLGWEEFRKPYGEETTLQFDFSTASLERRSRHASPKLIHQYKIGSSNGSFLSFELRGHVWQSALPTHLLHQHLLLKCALNISCTLVMGRLGRYTGNVMVYVRPTNKKLVDRSIRYIELLLKEKGIDNIPYEKICHMLFEEFAASAVNEPIVLKTLLRILTETQKGALHVNG